LTAFASGLIDRTAEQGYRPEPERKNEGFMRYCLMLAAILALPGCIVRTAANVATAPIKAGSKAADWATTSQDEADRQRGREMRKKCRESGGEDC